MGRDPWQGRYSDACSIKVVFMVPDGDRWIWVVRQSRVYIWLRKRVPNLLSFILVLQDRRYSWFGKAVGEGVSAKGTRCDMPGVRATSGMVTQEGRF